MLKVLIIFVMNILSIDAYNPLVIAKLYNNYTHDIHFQYCNIFYGNQTEQIQKPIKSNSIQNLIFVPSHNSTTHINGKCYFDVPINHHEKGFIKIVLEIIFYRELDTNQEYYGMTNSDHYLTKIEIEDHGHPSYYIISFD